MNLVKEIRILKVSPQVWRAVIDIEKDSPLYNSRYVHGKQNGDVAFVSGEATSPQGALEVLSTVHLCPVCARSAREAKPQTGTA